MLIIFKNELKKNFYSPFSILFRFCFPIIVILMQLFIIKNINKIELITNFIILSSFSFSLMNVALNVNSDLIEKRIKQLSLAKFSKIKYLFGFLLYNLLLYLIFNYIFVIILSAAFKINYNWAYFFISVILSVFCFMTMFMLGILISTIKNQRLCMVTVITLFYVILLLSGVLIPIEYIGHWMFYLSQFTIIGDYLYYINHFLRNDIINVNFYWIILLFVYFFLFFVMMLFFWNWE